MKSITTTHWLLIGAALICVLLIVTVFTVVRYVTPSAPTIRRVPGEQFLTLSGGRIRYQDDGSGTDALLFLHGFNDQLGAWNETWTHLQGCGRKIRLDVPGFGDSVWNDNSYRLNDQAERLREFLDALAVERVTVVGGSMGGSLAVAFAARYPQRVRNAALLAPSGYPDSLHYPGIYGRLVRPGVVNRLGNTVAATAAYKRLFPTSKALQATSVTSSYGDPWAEQLRQLQVPVVLLWSRGDPSFHAAQNVADAIPRSLLIPLAHDATHLLPDTRPQLIAAVACALTRTGQDLTAIRANVQPLLDARGDR